MTTGPRYRTTFLRLLGFLRPYKWSMLVSVLLAVGQQAAGLIGVFLTGSVAAARRQRPITAISASARAATT